MVKESYPEGEKDEHVTSAELFQVMFYTLMGRCTDTEENLQFIRRKASNTC